MANRKQMIDFLKSESGKNYYEYIVANIDNNVIDLDSMECEDEDIDPLEEFFIDVMEKAFGG